MNFVFKKEKKEIVIIVKRFHLLSHLRSDIHFWLINKMMELVQGLREADKIVLRAEENMEQTQNEDDNKTAYTKRRHFQKYRSA